MDTKEHESGEDEQGKGALSLGCFTLFTIAFFVCVFLSGMLATSCRHWNAAAAAAAHPQAPKKPDFGQALDRLFEMGCSNVIMLVEHDGQQMMMQFTTRSNVVIIPVRIRLLEQPPTPSLSRQYL